MMNIWMEWMGRWMSEEVRRMSRWVGRWMTDKWMNE